MAEHIIPLRTSDFSGPAPNVEKCQCWLCANEKAALAAEIDRLRAALEQIADTDPDDGTAWFHNVARAALEGK